MIFVRSLIFNILFYVTLILYLVLGCWFLLGPRIWAIRALQSWGRTSLVLLKAIVGITYEIRGREHIPEGAVMLAGKHQSFWETFALLPLVDDPAVVLKRELTFIPLFGWFCLKFKMIAVDRSAGRGALKSMMRQGREAVEMGRQILVFPEGTRRAPGAEPDYKPGVDALYLQLGVACVPFGLNSGLYWPRREFLRKPGKIIVEFGPPIPPGLPRKAFSARLQDDIEAISNRLLEEAATTETILD